MNTTKQNHKVIQKYPLPRVLPEDHPCCNNVQPYYFGDIDGNHKTAGRNNVLQVLPPVRLQYEENSTGDNINKVDNKDKLPIEENILGIKSKPQLSTDFDHLKDEYNLGELLGLKVTEIQFLLERLIPHRALVFLAGESEIGKSTLYTQLSLAIVKGDQEFLGFKINAIYRRVLIISTEDGPHAFSFRLIKQLNGSKIDVKIQKNLVVIFNYEDLETRIREILNQTPVDLVIIDAFADVYGDCINVSNDVRRFLNKFSDINNKYQCSTLFVHHVGKSKKKQQSAKDQLLGSVGIEGKARNVLMLSFNGKHQLSIVKGNYVSREDKEKPIYLNFDEKTLTFSIAKESVIPDEVQGNSTGTSSSSSSNNRPGRKRAIDLYNQAIKLYDDGKGMSQVEIAKRVGRDKSTVCKWIKAYNESKGYDLSNVEDVD